MKLVLFGVVGILYGLILQRSGFCFARAALELFLLRGREAVGGVLAGLIAGTVGFAAVALVRAHLGLATDGHLLALPFGLGTLLGAALFGLGMSLAGMCVVGSLLRLGEGYVVGALALVGAVIGAALDPFRAFLPRQLGTPLAAASLAQWVGLPAAALLTVAVLALIWRIAIPRAPGPVAAQPPPYLALLTAPPVIGGLLLSLLNTVQMATYQPWTVAYPLGLASSAAQRQLRPSLLSDGLPLLVLDAGIVLGAMASALLGRELRLRWPRQWRQVGASLAGGVLMGWGVQLAHGCSIGGLFSALPSLSLSAWLFLPGLAFGAWIGSLAVRRIG